VSPIAETVERDSDEIEERKDRQKIGRESNPALGIV
jgi:hypothetical protein